MKGFRAGLSMRAGIAAAARQCYTIGAMDPNTPSPDSHFAMAQGCRVHYRDLGPLCDGDVLALIHGWGGSTKFWRANIPVLAKSHRVVLPDLPGHGFSESPRGDCSIGDCAAAVAAVLDDAGVREAVLVGHSMGAAVACRFAREHPRRVRALVSVDGALIAYRVSATQREEFLARFRGPDYQTEVARFIRAWFRTRCDVALRERVCEDVLRTPQPVLVSAFASVLDAAEWELPASPWPLFLITAPSPLWNDDYVARVRARAPLMEHRVVPGAGHFLMLEQPEFFNAALAEFVARLALAGRDAPAP